MGNYLFNNGVLYEFEKVYFAPNMRDFELVVCKALKQNCLGKVEHGVHVM